MLYKLSVGALSAAIGLLGLSAVASADTSVVTLCHATGSETNPYVMITISSNGLNGHVNHDGDFIPAPGATDCSNPGPGPGPTPN